MNVYDFDGTIYSGDSTADFYIHCLKRYPAALKSVPGMIFAFVLYLLNLYSTTRFKERMYKFLHYVPDVDKEINEFWNINQSKIKAYYSDTHRDSDVVISASPEFLLAPICERLGIKTLIASRVDKKTGKYEGENCRDKEKVRRFYEWKADAEIDTFYSDSLADTPLAELAERAYIVNGGRLIPWDDYKPPKYKMFLSREFMTFLIVGVINTFAGSVFSMFYRSFITNDVIAFLPGFVSANILSYFLNSACTFRDYNFGVVKYLKFLISCMPNLIVQIIMVALLSGIFHLPSLIVYLAAAVIGVPATFVCVKLFAFAKK